ncbi:phosphoribosylformylglycinamidine synthase, partial [Candidatus Bathyarchaeota archaeon]|nr:phosphoribosylformylglycinamidine synthase [Candidatus Bathyarchaeota archaeon]
MVTRIVVCPKPGTPDALGETRKRQISDFLKMNVLGVQTSHGYTLDIELTPDEVLSVTTNLLVDPVTQAVATYNDRVFDWLVEVGYKLGVTDNVGRTTRIAVQDLLGRKLRDNELVFTSTQYMITGTLSIEEIQKIGRELLANELIETVAILNSAEVKSNGIRIPLPIFKSDSDIHVKEYDLNVSDEELLAISRRGILALDLHEMKAIKDYFNSSSVITSRTRMGLPQNPTDVELEMIAQTWSEHCKHKIFNAKVMYTDEESGETKIIDSLFKTYIRGTTEEVRDKVGWLVSVFEDNAGVVAFNDKLNVVAKVETHNSPSALEPYGGA